MCKFAQFFPRNVLLIIRPRQSGFSSLYSKRSDDILVILSLLLAVCVTFHDACFCRVETFPEPAMHRSTPTPQSFQSTPILIFFRTTSILTNESNGTTRE